MPKIYSARYIGDSHNYYETKTLYHIIISRTTENKFLIRTKNNEVVKVYETEKDVSEDWSEIKSFGVLGH